jgi:hypothetical protein
MDGLPTSMIGLCQEGKSSPDAVGRSAGVNSFCPFSACVGLSAAVSISNRTRLPFAASDQRVVFNRRLSLGFLPVSKLINGSVGAQLARPVGLTARPGRLALKNSLLRRRKPRDPAPGNASGHDPRPPDTPRAYVPPRASHDWRSLFAFRGRTAAPAGDCSAAPFSRPQ